MYPGIFVTVIYVLLCLLCILFMIIHSYVFFKNKIAKDKKKWQQCIQSLVSNAVFDLQPDEATIQTAGKLLRNCHFRNYLIVEIIQAKKNLAGDATVALRNLYESLALDNDSFAKVQSLRWHIKAKGIQELSIMDQTKYVKKIFRLSNHSNELVRNEAQCGLVNFYGFRGLRFLNVISYSISQWQQIQLLDKMNGQIPEDMSVMKKWLRSSNESLVIFSLKLATHYNCIELHAEVISCLKMNYQVRIHVMAYLKNMPTQETGDILLADYQDQCKLSKSLTLKTLQAVGNASHVWFLIGLLENAEQELIPEILETLLVLNPPRALQPANLTDMSQNASLHIITNGHAA